LVQAIGVCSLSFDYLDDLNLVFASDEEREYKSLDIPNQNFWDDNGIFSTFQTTHDFIFLKMKTVGQRFTQGKLQLTIKPLLEET
jgi:hypothetical protein|tara:strand:- start:43 stop:297 length:255 start_codon:yes stop_codon:yes gene_type:complete